MNEIVPLSDMERLAGAIARSGLFGMKTPDQALALMAIAQAEGRHPALAARDYHIIQGNPAKKAEAMMRDFLASGGRVEWHELTDDVAEATFSHPQGGSVKLRWDKQRVKQAGINNPMHSKYPRQMLRSRLISEGVRTVYPTATSGMYVPEEVADFAPAPRTMHDVTPPAEPQVVEQELIAKGESAANLGVESLRDFWRGLSSQERGTLGARGRGMGPHFEAWLVRAQEVEAAATSLAEEEPVLERTDALDEWLGTPSKVIP